MYIPAPTTTATHIASAVYRAAAHYQDTSKETPSVICIASSSDMLGTSNVLRSAIEYAVDAGVTVVVSAGNSGADAGSYIPAAYGDIEGVICVGASNSSDYRISSSNTGDDVDILAPGDMILAKSEDGADVFMQGTSPAAAIVAGSALAELSMNGSLTPAELEATLVSAAIASPTSGAPPVIRSTPLAAATISLPDGFLTDPALLIALSSAQFPEDEDESEEPPAEDPNPGDTSAPPAEPSAPRDEFHQQTLNMLHGSAHGGEAAISVYKISSQEMGFTFPVDFSLLDGEDLFTLSNGYTWRIRCTDDLSSWEIPQGKLVKNTAPDGSVWLTARVPITSETCYLRIEVAPPVEP